MGCNNNNNIVPSCGCPSPCDNPIACGCKIKINSECVTNTVELPCANVAKGLTLDKTLEGIDDYLCDLLELIQEVGTAITLANVGNRVRVFKGVSGTGVREFRTLESVDTDTLTIKEDGDRILFEAAATTPQELTVTSSCGAGNSTSLIEDYSNNSLQLRGLVSSSLDINTDGGCISIEQTGGSQFNKLMKTPNQVSSVTTQTVGDVPILGTFTGSNVFTPSEMVNTSSYSILVRGVITGNVGYLLDSRFLIKLGGQTLTQYEFAPSDLLVDSEADYIITAELGFSSTSAYITGNIQVVDNSRRTPFTFVFRPFAAPINTSINQTLTVVHEHTQGSQPITIQTYKAEVNKIR